MAKTVFGAGPPWILRTRQTPKRAAELIAGGSLYRVYKGFILSRQRILAIDTVGEGPARRCEVTLDERCRHDGAHAAARVSGVAISRGQGRAARHRRGRSGEAPSPPTWRAKLRELGAW